MFKTLIVSQFAYKGLWKSFFSIYSAVIIGWLEKLEKAFRIYIKTPINQRGHYKMKN